MSEKEKIVDKLDKLIELLSRNKKEQPLEEMRANIKKASNEEILRQQIEMMAEYSRTCGVDRSPEASEAIASLYGWLFKAKYGFFVCFFIAFLGFFRLVKSIPIKGIQFIKR